MVVVDRFKKKPKFMSPKEVIEAFSLSKGQTVIDYGSGAGFWAIPLAKKVGPTGTVFAVDDQAERLAVLSSLSKISKVANIKIINNERLGNPVQFNQKVDLILVSNVLSEVTTDGNLLTSLANNAEVGTKLVVIDWNQESIIGPLCSERVVEDQVILLAAKAGFKFKSQLETGTFHFGLMFEYTGEEFHAKKK